MKFIEQIIAENIKKLRKSRRLSQTALADKASLSMHTILRIEKGHRLPRKANIIAIAKALGCEPEVLFQNHENLDSSTSIEDNSLSKKELGALVKKVAHEAIREFAGYDGNTYDSIDQKGSPAEYSRQLLDLFEMLKKFDGKQLKQAKFMIETIAESNDQDDHLKAKNIKKR